jgi:outer membrane protein assembly factor BamB
LEIGIVKHLALFLLTSSLVVAEQAGKTGDPKALDWFQFRGPNRDALSTDSGLLQQWPSSGPPLLWKAAGLGTGYSSVSVSGTRVFTMGESAGKSFLLALNAADGKVLWKTPVGAPGGERGAGPRSTPATDGAIVVALSQNGELVGVQAATGRQIWASSMERMGGQRPNFSWSESPLLDGNLVVVTPGGSGGVVALAKANGQRVWQARVKGEAHYTSLAVAEIGGIRQYLALTKDSVSGIAARNGAIAWTAEPAWCREAGLQVNAVAATPVYKDGTLFISAGYGAGHNAFRVAGAGGRFQIQEAYKGKELENHHGGMVVVGDHVYGANNTALVCMELKTGKVAWQDRCVGKGSLSYADGHLVVRGEQGGVALVEASPAGYKEKGRFNLPKSGGEGAWAYPVVSGGRLYLRDWETLYCYDVKAK